MMWFLREKSRCVLRPTSNHVNVWVYPGDVRIMVNENELDCIVKIDYGVEND